MRRATVARPTLKELAYVMDQRTRELLRSSKQTRAQVRAECERSKQVILETRRILAELKERPWRTPIAGSDGTAQLDVQRDTR